MIKKTYKKYKEVISYLFFGVLTTVVNYIVYLVCTMFAGMNFGVATVIAWFFAVAFAYVTNKLFVFNSRGTNVKKELTSFLFFRILSLGIDIIFMQITVGMLLFNDKIMKLLSNVVVVAANYVFSKIFIFKKGDV